MSRKSTFVSVHFLLIGLLVLLFIVASLKQSSSQYSAHATGSAYFVSKNGNNADGTSWATAWSELENINWSIIQPDDTIYVDGGTTSMTYTTMLDVQKSGTSTAPIIIQMSTDAGRNGQVIIFGGRQQKLPYCNEPSDSYTYQTTGVLQNAINLNNNSYVTIDGTKWHGISIHGFNYDGVIMGPSSANNTLKNIKIYDNGTAATGSNGWYTDRPGIYLAGSNLTLYQVDIHDNGQDGLQAGSTFSNVTIQHSWLHNTRQNPSNTSVAEAFNYPCTHQDGFQVYTSGTLSGVTITDSVLGPGLMQGVILGDESGGSTTSTVNNVTLKNLLFINTYQGTNMIDGSYFPQNVYTKPTNWVIDHVTGYEYQTNDEVVLSGTNHTLTNSIYYGGSFHLSTASFTSNTSNCQYGTSGDTSLVNGQTANPLFTTDVSSYTNATSFSTLRNTDFSLQSTSPCLGLGSTITSVAQLISTATNTLPTPTATPTPTPLSGLSIEAKSGIITPPFQITTDTPTYISQTVDTFANGPSAGGRATYTFTAPASGNYVINMNVNAASTANNSVYVNIDSDPANDTGAEPNEVWDVPVTIGFQQETVSWRGNGTPDANQYVPKVFSLAGGVHTLYIRGREANTQLHNITITLYSPTNTSTPTLGNSD